MQTVQCVCGLLSCCSQGERRPRKAVVKCQGNLAGTLQAVLCPAVAKTGVKMTLDECQSVFTLIRTDTTHDLSQKAEKVCLINKSRTLIPTSYSLLYICPLVRAAQVEPVHHQSSSRVSLATGAHCPAPSADQRTPSTLPTPGTPSNSRACPNTAALAMACATL